MLATSREPLGLIGEVTWSIPGMAIAEATRLFEQRAAAARPTFALDPESDSVVAEICERLDGMPLAIELAAARLRALPVTEIAKRLDDRFALLTTGGRAGPARHQTLRATIDWSYQPLTEPERRLFARLSVFVGPWTLAAAEAVCADPTPPHRTDPGSAYSAGGPIPDPTRTRHSCPLPHAGNDSPVRRRTAPAPGRTGPTSAAGTPPTSLPWLKKPVHIQKA